MDKRFIQKLEFYITNVCNLTCSNCNRFNDHDFRGWQKWSDYEADYQEWGRKLAVEGLVILGGEPLLNPSICDWIVGLNRCFGKNVQVLTNGTRLNHTPGLYEALIQEPADHHYANWIGISLHNENDLDRYFEEIQKFLRGQIRTYHGPETRDATGHLISYSANYTFMDDNNVAVRIWIQDNFYTAAIHRGPPEFVDGNLVPGKLQVFDNDPELAHRDCGFVQWKNYHMIRGQLYKCGPCVLIGEFDAQHRLDISEQDRALMNSYVPLSPWDDDKTTQSFFKNLDNPIPQCKFCPTQSQRKYEKIMAVRKGRNTTSSFG